MNKTSNMAHWLVTIALLVLATSVVGAEQEKPSPESLRAYKEWAKSYSKFEPDENDQGYQSLLKLQDADLLFLQGMHHNTKHAVRRLSSKAVGRLKTDRSFDILVAQLSDKNMFDRETALRTLAMFQESRCVAPIVRILKSDPEPQLRKDAAYELQAYDDRDSIAALSDALKDKDVWVASMAAYSLGVLQIEEAIEPAYELVLKASMPRDSEGGALAALTVNRNKKSLDHLIDLLDILPRKHGARGKELAEVIDARILCYAEMTTPTLGPVPDTPEQWREWWKEANTLFDDKMQLLSKREPEKIYENDQFATDLSKLKLLTAVDSQTYRPGDPIRLDIVFRNSSDEPFKVVFPDAPSGWYSTMGWGIKLERIDENRTSILDIKPSGFYEGSYSGPPPFSTLHSKQNFRDSICLQYWLRRCRIWPLSEGTYEMTVSFDSSQFPGIKAKGPQRTGLWTSPPIRFKVSGSVREDPEELLALIADKTNKKWLRTDLTSRRDSRKKEAWWALYEYGDTRLEPLLEKLAGKDAMRKNLRYVDLRRFP